MKMERFSPFLIIKIINISRETNRKKDDFHSYLRHCFRYKIFEARNKKNNRGYL